MVGPVNLGMAVRASPVEVLDGTKRLRLRWMAAGNVARVANPWHPDFQQLWVAAAMWIMAVGAVFHDRRVLPQERTTTFGMAAEAVLVGRALKQLARIRASMRVVATGAGDLAFAIRHVRGAL